MGIALADENFFLQFTYPGLEFLEMLAVFFHGGKQFINLIAILFGLTNLSRQLLC